MTFKRTKIICTIGPATESFASLRKLYEAGMNVARLNMSHSNHQNAKKVIDRIKKLNLQVKNPVRKKSPQEKIPSGKIPSGKNPFKNYRHTKIKFELLQSYCPYIRQCFQR